MAVNLGAAFVDIVPSTSNLASDLRRQISGPLSAAAGRAGGESGQSFGSRFASAVGSTISTSVRAVSDTLIGGISAAATVAGGIFATSLFSGFQRFTTIEDSTRALTILLGDATHAAELLDQVLGVVRGTPFNLDQFAAAAQRMVGMGIEAEKIPGYLEAIGEASATQGRRANEFADRLATVFGQISAANQVQLIDVWRISDTGVPALQILANEFGLTTDAMKDMISDGAVPAGRALDALATGIVEGTDGVAGATVAFGGTMAGLRDTLTGAVGGFSAARARFGAAFIAPLAPALTAGLTALAGLLDELGPKLGAAIADVVDSPGFERFVGWLTDLPNQVGDLSGMADRLGDAFGPLVGIFAALGASGLAGPLRALGLAIPGPAVMAAVGAFAGLLAVSPELRDALVDLGEALLPLVKLIGDHTATQLRVLTPLIASGLTKAIELLTPVIDGATVALESLSGWLSNLGGAVRDAWERDGLSGALGVLGSQLRGAWDSTLYPALVEIGNRFGDWAGSLWETYLEPRVAAAWDGFGRWLENDGPQRLLTATLNLGNALVDWITTDAIPLGSAKISEFIDAITAWASSPQNLQKMGEAGAKLAAALVIGMSQVHVQLALWAVQLQFAIQREVFKISGRISEFFRTLGVSIIIAIANGIREAAPEIAKAVGDAFKSIPSRLNDLIPGFNLPDISGFHWPSLPSFGDGGVVPGARGRPTLILAHGQETVLPTHKASFAPAAIGGRNVETTINAPGITDPWAVADLVGQVVGWRLAQDGTVA